MMPRLAVAACLFSTAVVAGEADVVGVEATRAGTGWRFDVTVSHNDEGWEHYADAWRIVGPDGTVYGTRELLHPHVGEQPFTRSLSDVAIPSGVQEVAVEAHDKVHGWGGAAATVRLNE